MGLLAPLYFAGLLAIGLPIVFHLIRRAPHGRQPFSSLMFLTQSPPRQARRNRLTNILLLLLRAAAFALLAFAFARPFLSAADDADLAKPRGRRVAILVDVSASMRRDDLWQQAVAHAEQTLADLRPEDEAALLFFDQKVRTGLGFGEWNELAPSIRISTAKARLAAARPGWGETRIGDAMSAAADMLAEEEGVQLASGSRDPAKPGTGPATAPTGADPAAANRQLVLISDLQQGGKPEALQGYQWPPSVLLQVKAVTARHPGNASVHRVDSPAGDAAADRSRLRVRVANQPGAAGEQFTLTWANADGPIAGVEPQKTYAPAARSQVVGLTWPSPAAGKPAADRLLLGGDSAPFDNALYVVPPKQEFVRALFLGDDAADDVGGLRYYLLGASAETSLRRVDLAAKSGKDALAEADLAGARIAFVASGQGDDRATVLRRFAEAGGEVVWVLKDAAAAAGLSLVAGIDLPEISEAPPSDFALLARVDTGHPLFAPFASAQLADFTKIHFWKHRKIALPTPVPSGTKVLASFDDELPFLVEVTVGRGRVFVMASGWHPADSQFALSTKFLPFIDRLIRRTDGLVVAAQLNVGDAVALPAADPSATRTLAMPDGRKIDLAAGQTAIPGEAIDQPGVYALSAAGDQTPIAVNLAADESRTAPIDVDDLERFGAMLGVVPTSAELIARQRQLRTAEIESKQKLWRWGILCVLGLLAVETFVAGNLIRRGPKRQVAA